MAVASLAHRLRDKGWLLIAAVMVLFSLLGSTMGFSVETLGFYALFMPLMAALGYDRLVTASMIILGALVGVMAATVNPFSIGVAAGEAGVSHRRRHRPARAAVGGADRDGHRLGAALCRQGAQGSGGIAGRLATTDAAGCGGRGSRRAGRQRPAAGRS